MGVLVIGVDPGLVHTGVVAMYFDPKSARMYLASHVVDGPDAGAVAAWCAGTATNCQSAATVFIEGYRPRSNLNADVRMLEAVRDMSKALPHSTVLPNMGVTKVVKRPLMELLNVWNFSTSTHHQDLRSAARIALLGMLKDVEFNRVLTQVVHDHRAGETWNVLLR